MKTELKQSGVIFNEIDHTYTLKGKSLSGITGILKKYLFPDKYNDVPEFILQRAAERGSRIHEEIDMYVKGLPFAEQTEETKAFIKWSKENGINFTHSEFLVSDSQHFASSIDIIDNNLNLCDIKTTSVLDTEYLSWQLSIYAYLFELQTGEKSGKLYGIHLKDNKCKCAEVPRIDNDVIIDLLQAAAEGKEPSEYVNPLRQMSVSEEQQMAKIYELECAIVEIETQAKEYKERQEQMKAIIESSMRERGLKSVKTDRMSITLKADSIRESLDTKRIKEEKPELFEQYKKTLNVKGGLLVKLLNN